MHTFNVEVCKYANNILFTLKIPKNALKKWLLLTLPYARACA